MIWSARETWACSGRPRVSIPTSDPISTYAVYWVEEAIRDALLNRTATIRLPAYMTRLLTRWERARLSLHQKWGYPPSFEEVAAHLGISEREQKLLQRAQRTLRVMSESCTRANGDATSFGEPIDTYAGPDERLQNEEEHEELATRMRRLDERERNVVECRFGLRGESPLTLREIGNGMGLTREWISTIRNAPSRSWHHCPGGTRNSQIELRPGLKCNGLARSYQTFFLNWLGAMPGADP